MLKKCRKCRRINATVIGKDGTEVCKCGSDDIYDLEDV